MSTKTTYNYLRSFLYAVSLISVFSSIQAVHAEDCFDLSKPLLKIELSDASSLDGSDATKFKKYFPNGYIDLKDAATRFCVKESSATFLTFYSKENVKVLSFDGLYAGDETDPKKFVFIIQGAKGIAFRHGEKFLETSNIFENWYFGVTTKHTRLYFKKTKDGVFSVTNKD